MTTGPSPRAPARLARTEAPVGSIWHHIFLDRYADPLGFGYAASRFSDPHEPPPPRSGVYYVAASFEAAVLETIVRDRRNDNAGVMLLDTSDLAAFVHVHVTITVALDLVDLRGGLPLAMGIPTDAVRASAHEVGQRISLGIYQHSDHVDGLRYPSRMNGEDNIAIYDRAIANLAAGPRRTLGICEELAPVLTAYRLALV